MTGRRAHLARHPARHLVRAWALILCLGALAPASAQSELMDLAQLGCQAAGHLSGFEWICYAAELPGSVLAALESVHVDLTAFGEELLYDYLEDALAVIGQRTGAPRLERAFAEVRAAVSEGPARLREAVRDLALELRLENVLAPRSPEHSPDWWGEEAGRIHPNVAAAEAVAAERRTQIAVSKAESAAVHGANVELAEEVLGASATQDAAARVLAPAAPGGGGVPGASGGTAARLEDRARTAVSSRAALVVLTEGLADLMRQEAVFSGAIVEHLRVLSQQQVMTTWQLQLAVNSLSDQLAAEVARDQAALQRYVSRAFDEGRQLAHTFAHVSSEAGRVLEPDLGALAWESVGW